MAATAERDYLAATQTVLLAVHVKEFDFAFDAQWTVISDRNPRR